MAGISLRCSHCLIEREFVAFLKRPSVFTALGTSRRNCDSRVAPFIVQNTLWQRSLQALGPHAVGVPAYGLDLWYRATVALTGLGGGRTSTHQTAKTADTLGQVLRMRPRNPLLPPRYAATTALFLSSRVQVGAAQCKVARGPRIVLPLICAEYY